MLRLSPTVISLTPSDVIEVTHRQRFRNYLECNGDDQCLAFTPAEAKAIRSTARSKPSSSRAVNDEATLAKPGGSPPAYNRVRPLVADLPLLMPSDKRVEDDIPRPPEGDDGVASPSTAGGDQHQGSSWSPQLCLRPKRGLAAVTSTNVNAEADSPAVMLQDSLESPSQESPMDRHNIGQLGRSPFTSSQLWLPESLPPRPTERSPSPPASIHRVRPSTSAVGFRLVDRLEQVRASTERADPRWKSEPRLSTPRRSSSSGSSGSLPTAAVSSARVCPV